MADRSGRARIAAALLADLVLVAVFCAIGRRNHAEGVTAAGVAQTAGPFLAGTVAGWLASRGWRAPAAVVPTGAAAWLGTVVVGMAIRRLTGAGTAVSFVVVATLTTAALLLGWRAGAALVARR